MICTPPRSLLRHCIEDMKIITGNDGAIDRCCFVVSLMVTLTKKRSRNPSPAVRVMVEDAGRLWHRRILCIWDVSNRSPNCKCQLLTVCATVYRNWFMLSWRTKSHGIFTPMLRSYSISFNSLTLYTAFLIMNSKSHPCLMIWLRNYQLKSTVTWQWAATIPRPAPCGHTDNTKNIQLFNGDRLPDANSNSYS